jgi:hypothetical protein
LSPCAARACSLDAPSGADEALALALSQPVELPVRTIQCSAPSADGVLLWTSVVQAGTMPFLLRRVRPD